MLQHFRGIKSKYSYFKDGTEAEKKAHENGIYFATDTKEIYMNGEAYGKGSVSSGNASTTSDITISGGPLANDMDNTERANLPENWKIKEGNTVTGYKIPSGSSLQDVLSALFCVELWQSPLPELIEGDLNPKINAINIPWPTTTTYTVGETITISTSVTGSILSGASSTGFNSNFTYGYSESASGPVIGKNSKPSSVALKDITFSTGDGSGTDEPCWSYTIDATRLDNFKFSTTMLVNDSGAGKYTNKTKVQPTEAGGVSLMDPFSFTVKKGENKLTGTYSVSLINYSAKTQAFPAIYHASSLGNLSSTPIAGLQGDISKSRTASAANVTFSKTVTGVYPMYTTGKWAISKPITSGYENSGSQSSNAYNAYEYSDLTTLTTAVAKSDTITNGTSKFYAFIAYGNGGFTFKIEPDWNITGCLTKDDNKVGFFTGDYTGYSISEETLHGAKYKVYTFNLPSAGVVRLEFTHI